MTVLNFFRSKPTTPKDPPVFNNITRSSDLKNELYKVFTELSDILVDHAGPFATSCVIGSRWRQVNDIDEFTKDGIRILTHLIVSEDVAARFAARMTRFIGFSVDKRCHDGTTTSMLLFCQLALIAIAKLDYDISDPERYRWWKNLHTTLDNCLSFLDDIKITEEDILERAKSFGIETSSADVRGAMAYHMAMISSKGDHDLASKISEVIRSAPKSVYGMFKDIPTLLESEERYTIKKQDYDLDVSANLGHAQYWNYKNDTQFLAEDAVIFFTGNDIVKNSFESSFLRAFINTSPSERANLPGFGVEQGWEAFHEGRRNLVIFSHMLQDNELFADIMEFNRENPNCKIVHFNVHIADRLRKSLTKTFLYMAGAQRFDDVGHTNAFDAMIGLTRRGVKVHAIGHHVQVSGLYDKNGEVFHPYYTDPTAFVPYTEFLAETEELIDFAKNNITNNALDPEEITHLTSLYRSMTCQEINDIEIGGLAHEQYSNRTVYEDAMGAALSAVNDGVVLGGYGKIAKLLLATDNFDSWVNELGDLENRVADALISIVSGSTRSTDEKIRQLISTTISDKWSYIVADPDDFYRGDDHVSSERFGADQVSRFLKRERGRPILLQAWSGYHEQFRRFKDMLPKIANSSGLSDMRIREGDDVR